MTNPAPAVRSLPPSWHSMVRLRSYAVVGENGDLYRVEVRRCPHTGLTLQATFKV